jgi:methyltransferase-like protein
MSEDSSSSYDEVPYISGFFPASHPERMATVATLFGLTPPPVDRCRVLELGCAGGGNLLPMAQALPGSHFVGIDLSPRQIADGQAIVERLGLPNVDLRAMSITDMDEGFGRFDYILCHGVYSWVPEAVRNHILAVCKRNLAGNGVAYISYNTYPGWHLRGMVREMLVFHTRPFADPHERVRQARAFLGFLSQSAGDPNGLYTRILKQEANYLEHRDDSYLFHEHLEETNHPVYFTEFVTHAAAAGLQYLGPARFKIGDANLPPEVRGTLEGLATDRIRREQYLDFLDNRTFRQSLLCHAEVALRDAPVPQALAGLRIAALARPESAQPDVRSQAAEEFSGLGGERVTTNRPLIKAALVALFAHRPRSMTLEELRAEVQSLLGPSADEIGLLAEGLLHCHLSNLVGLHVHEPTFVREAGPRPLASPVARLQAEADDRVVNLLGRYVQLEGFDRLMLKLLDGTRDRPALRACLAAQAAEGALELHGPDGPVRDPAQIQVALDEWLEPSLHRLAGHALLIG